MRSSLDEFARYIEKRKEIDAEGALSPAVSESKPVSSAVKIRGASETAPEARYILRNGVTIPVSKADAPSNQVVAEEQGAEGASAAPSDAALWQRLPRHIQLLVSMADQQEEEAAQKYYTRGFKESRRELIQRLLDPTLTLEDTARVLGVVPATVRRYTNRGVLPHHRTVGQQRRFRLSDVLGFLEAQQGRGLVGD